MRTQLGKHHSGKVQRHSSNLDILHLKLADQGFWLIVKRLRKGSAPSSLEQWMSPTKCIALRHQSSDGVFINGNYNFLKCVKLAKYQTVLLVSISQT